MFNGYVHRDTRSYLNTLRDVMKFSFLPHFSKSNKSAPLQSDAVDKNKTLEVLISGLHCTSCSLTIDGELEDTDGVVSASTSYAKAVTTVTFSPQKVTEKKIRSIIKKLGYSVVSVEEK